MYGRSAEQTAIDALLAAARSGRSGTLVVRGEAGIGKSALLRFAVEQATDLRVLRSVGIEAEAELAFAGLHMLLGGFVDRLDVLPAPQAAVLRGAFGLAGAPDGDRFLAGLATLSLLSEVAEERPLLVVVDDAQWLDRASTEALLFAARRLEAEPIALVFAARDGHPFTAQGLPELRLSGLDGTAGAALLDDHAGDLAPHVRDRILDEAAGNPLALRELPGALTPEQRAGEVPAIAYPVGTQPVAGRIEESFRDRIRALPAKTRLLLLIAAADDSGDLGLILKAAELRGASVDDMAPAEDRRLVELTGESVVFAHPLVRSAAYRTAPLAQRLAAHRTLSGVLGHDPARRAWHLAASTTAPDEAVAAELERTAEAARARGGYSEVAHAYQRAAQFTPDPAQRARRLARAAEMAANAGQGALACKLAEQAAPYASDQRTRAELTRVRAAIAHEQGSPVPVAELAEAALELGGQSPEDGTFMLLESVLAAWAHDREHEVRDVIARAPVNDGRFARLTAAVTGMGAEDLPNPMRVRALLRELGDTTGHPLWQRVSILFYASWAGEVESAVAGMAQVVAECRSTGAIGLLPRACLHLGRGHLFLGQHRNVRAVAEEGLKIAKDTDQSHFAAHLSGLLACVSAIEGDEAGCRTAIGDMLDGEPMEQATESRYALDLLDLGLGRYDAVVRRMAGERHASTMRVTNALANRVEAAVHAGRPDLAQEPAGDFTAWAEAAGHPWSEAMALRCQALLAAQPEAGELYAQAVRLHREDRAQPFERARTELLYGEWLRRARHRNDAREMLHSALETFDRLGARPWAERAGAELRAAGDARPVRDVAPDLLDRLTSQEFNVVRLAAEGLSNRDIGARLFLSPRTVGYHLYKAFPKLGVASRNQLMRLDLSAPSPP